MTMANIISYENNVMLAAILSLLLVILFVLLLHIYARWFLGQAHQRGRVVFGPARRLPYQSAAHTTTTTSTYTYEITTTTKGLDPTVINGIPLFVYGQDESKNDKELECAICLSKFEEKEEGRSLPRCSHAFHVGCIDMWLHSHTTCPICRAQVLLAVEFDQKDHHKPSSDAHDHDQTVESSSSSSSSTVEIVVENQDGNVGVRESPTSDCSLRRMLSWGGSRSENRVHPSLPL